MLSDCHRQPSKHPVFTALLVITATILLEPTLCMAQAKIEPVNRQNTSISDSVLIRCALGEASGDGKLSIMAVMQAIRNRGTTKGVYGCKAAHLDREPEWVWQLGKAALRDSLKTDLVKGATHWENTKAFGTPYWAKGHKAVAQVGNHTFYKRIK